MSSAAVSDRFDRVRARLGHDVWAAAVVDATGIHVATNRCTSSDDFELGSITKGLTGLLFVDAVERGDVDPEDRLGDHLPVHDASVAAITLRALSTHRSGLPGMPAGMPTGRRTASWLLRGANPYGDTLEELLSQLPGTNVGRQRAAYSNLGFQLLGHAIAAAAGAPYRDLLSDRLFIPLGLSSAYAPESIDELHSTAVSGRSRFGRPAAPWTGEAIAPAGGVRMSIDDAAALAAALLKGRAPGAAALDPVADFVGPMRIGAAWITVPTKQGDVVWHNGGTGGFRTWLGLNRTRDTAAVVLRARARSVDRLGISLVNT